MYPKIMKDGPNCTLETFCEMVEWSVERFGIDHVALGSDWYAGYRVEAINWWCAGRWARKSPLNIKSAFSDWRTGISLVPIRPASSRGSRTAASQLRT